MNYSLKQSFGPFFFFLFFKTRHCDKQRQLKCLFVVRNWIIPSKYETFLNDLQTNCCPNRRMILTNILDQKWSERLCSILSFSTLYMFGKSAPSATWFSDDTIFSLHGHVSRKEWVQLIAEIVPVRLAQDIWMLFISVQTIFPLHIRVRYLSCVTSHSEHTLWKELDAQ